MKKRIVSIIFALIVFGNISVIAFADCGPKDSVTVRVTGVEEGTEYYATLLSRDPSTGPASAYMGEEPPWGDNEPWSAFQVYSENDDYYYLQEHYEMEGNDVFCWGYYPPYNFKILLYFPETGEFISSEPQEHYAFNSYFTADIKDGEMEVFKGKGTTDIFGEIIAFLLRAAITAGLELYVALLFGYRRKREIRIILITNVVTQVMLNIVLNVANYRSGALVAAIFYVLAELFIFIAEGIVYTITLPKATENRTGAARAWLYAFAANFVSFVLGGILTIFLFTLSDVFMYI